MGQDSRSGLKLRELPLNYGVESELNGGVARGLCFAIAGGEDSFIATGNAGSEAV